MDYLIAYEPNGPEPMLAPIEGVYSYITVLVEEPTPGKPNGVQYLVEQ